MDKDNILQQITSILRDPKRLSEAKNKKSLSWAYLKILLGWYPIAINLSKGGVTYSTSADLDNSTWKENFKFTPAAANIAILPRLTKPVWKTLFHLEHNPSTAKFGVTLIDWADECLNSGYAINSDQVAVEISLRQYQAFVLTKMEKNFLDGKMFRYLSVKIPPNYVSLNRSLGGYPVTLNKSGKKNMYDVSFSTTGKRVECVGCQNRKNYKTLFTELNLNPYLFKKYNLSIRQFV